MQYFLCKTQKPCLKDPIQAVHDVQKPFKYNICHSNFDKKQELNIHTESVLESKKPFKCMICDSQQEKAESA